MLVAFFAARKVFLVFDLHMDHLLFSIFFSSNIMWDGFIYIIIIFEMKVPFSLFFCVATS